MSIVIFKLISRISEMLFMFETRIYCISNSHSEVLKIKELSFFPQVSNDFCRKL